ncbi:MAG: histidinol-phosphate aminotransferase family protein [Chloroflexi bacterium]|nr:histidinol-phosphate aminotransferase family protein [Chloroflexota bacterium]
MSVEHGGAPAGWLELSANLAPHGTPSAVRDAIARSTYSSYADLDPREAERHLARDAGVDPSWLMLTAGATEALRLVTDALLDARDVVLLAGPTYGEYARLAERRGARIDELRARPPRFELRASEIARCAAATRPRLVVVCDPNNPTGRLTGSAALRALARSLPQDAHLVVDESFLPFTEPCQRGVAGHPRAIAVRSLTKVLAIPGIRVGYVVATPALLERLRAVRDPWAVSAQACAAASVASWKVSAAALRDLARWRSATARILRAAGLAPVPSRAPFVLARAGPGARTLVRALARRHVAVRWCASFGLPEHIRVAVRPPDAQTRLAVALRAVRT